MQRSFPAQKERIPAAGFKQVFRGDPGAGPVVHRDVGDTQVALRLFKRDERNTDPVQVLPSSRDNWKPMISPA